MDQPPVEERRPPVVCGAEVDLADVQGLVRFGHGHMCEAGFWLLRIVDVEAARAWLCKAPVTHAATEGRRPETALQIAFTGTGLKALGVPEAVLRGFTDEFVTGMSGDANRSRRLGDLAENAPAQWRWGGDPEGVAHVLVMVYGCEEKLGAFEASLQDQDWQAGFEVQSRLAASHLDEHEPFGFLDGISQPRIDWQRERRIGDKGKVKYENEVTLGEVLLGYPNEYGKYTRRPLVDPAGDPAALDLPPAEDAPHRRDLARNGTYVVFRQLEQDVAGFWQFLAREAGDGRDAQWSLAEAMVGRRRTGEPLVPLTDDRIPGVGPKPADLALNQFTYASDADGHHCPFGAHVRRANPRTGDFPAGTAGLVQRLLRMLGFKRRRLREDLVASTRFHRILRRGREYGSSLSADAALAGDPTGEERGLHFICLGADPARQFEFVQNAWIETTKFDGLCEESDPLLGSRVEAAGGRRTDAFTLPQTDGPARRITGLPRFVTVRGGAYFFMPGLRALRYLAGAPSSAPLVPPAPPKDPGPLWLWPLHRALEIGLHIERRLEPFFRPALNRALREPTARLIQYLINRRRSDEELKLAEERIDPDEEASLDSITRSFAGHLLRSYQPGGFERGGNTKTHGLVRAEVEILRDLPDHLRCGIFKEPRIFKAYVRYSGPGPNLPNDIEDVGFVSMAIKVMGVPGPKLLDDEKATQDLLAVCTPTFVTPNTRENAKLQIWSFRDMPVFYFLNPLDSHLLDFLMQGLWNETQTNPLGARYWSCVPYLLGEGQAMMYSFLPRSTVKTEIPGVPFGRVPPNYLRDNMAATLSEQDVEFDIALQVQTDPHAMPIENASVRWPESLSPFVPAARVRIPRQTIGTQAHVDLAKRLSMNPWHALPEHRPLGNQSRARLRMYKELSTLRQMMNAAPHIEPVGDELPD